MNDNKSSGRRLLEINICDYGSTGRIMRDISGVLTERGWEIRCAYGRYKDPAHKPGDIIIGSKAGVYAHYAHTRLTGRTCFGALASKRATERLVAELEKLKPDVVHLHNLHSYYLNMPVLFEYLRKSGVRTVWTLHDCWAFTGNCGYFERSGCRRWLESCGNCPQRHAAGVHSLILDPSARNLREKRELITALPPEQLTIVTPSEWLAAYVRQSYLARYPLKVIYNGIERGSFKPLPHDDIIEKYHLEGKRLLLGVASVWDARKGLVYLEQLADLLGDGYKVAAIGLSDKQLAELPANMIGIKRTENVTELAKWYSAAFAFVNPTLEDNFPSTNIEALSCGTPVITFETGGCPEAIDEYTGIVTAEKTAQSLADAVREAERRGFTRQACVERSERFDKAVCAAEYLKLFEE